MTRGMTRGVTRGVTHGVTRGVTRGIRFSWRAVLKPVFHVLRRSDMCGYYDPKEIPGISLGFFGWNYAPRRVN